MKDQPEAASQPQHPARSGHVQLNVETVQSVIEEIRPLLLQNWNEAGLEKEASPLDPDWQSYIAMEADRRLGIVTLRVNGKLGGFVICFVGPNMQCQSTIWGQIDTIWLHPKLRRGRLGDRMLQFAEDKMKAAGAKVIKIDTSPRVGNWFVRGHGYTAQHVVLTKNIGG